MEKRRRTNIALLLVMLFLILNFLVRCTEAHDPIPSIGDASTLDSPEPPANITVCVDMQSATSADIEAVVKGAAQDGVPFTASIEMIPQEGGERDNIITRIHTELLAGKGPDVFIFDCHLPGLHDENNWKRLFPFLKQAFENRLFLPLDSYIANAKHIEWNHLLSSVMEAGIGEEGQMVLPLGYSFTTSLCPSEIALEEPLQPMTWDEMRTSRNPYILDVAGGRFSDLFGDLADYAEDTLLFSEDELLKRAMEAMELNEVRSRLHAEGELQNTFAYINGHSMVYTGVKLDDESPDYIMIPCYNLNGGLTVNVSSVAAINRNTKHPDESFAVLDNLLSKDTQQNSSFYRNGVQGMPVHTELGNKSNPLQNGWYMSDANFQSFKFLLSTIDSVKFFSPLDTEMMKIAQSGPCSEAEMKSIVHKHYTAMQMMLAES